MSSNEQAATGPAPDAPTFHWLKLLAIYVAAGVGVSLLGLLYAHDLRGGGCGGATTYGWPSTELARVWDNGLGHYTVTTTLSVTNLVLDRIFGAAVGLVVGCLAVAERMLRLKPKPASLGGLDLSWVLPILLILGLVLAVAITQVHSLGPAILGQQSAC